MAQPLDEEADEAVERIPHPDRDLTPDEWRERIREDWHAEIVPNISDQAVGWLKAKWGEHAKCPFCAAESWKVADMLVEQRTWASAAVQPQLPVACDNCGYTVHIDASKAGLVRPEDSEANE